MMPTVWGYYQIAYSSHHDNEFSFDGNVKSRFSAVMNNSPRTLRHLGFRIIPAFDTHADKIVGEREDEPKFRNYVKEVP